MFSYKLSQVTEQLNRAFTNKSVQDYIAYGIKLWCNQLNIDSKITNIILNYYQSSNEIQNITSYLWKRWQPIKTTEQKFLGYTTNWMQSALNSLGTEFLRQINVKSGNMEFIALIAFVITAVGYVIYVSNRPGQQSTHTEKLENYATNFSDTLIQKKSPQFLVLVIAAEKASLIKSIKEKQDISYSDSEELYELTNYLWLGSESAFAQKISNIKNYLVSPGEESEYDIYLVYLKLKQSDEGFKPSVNQLDRYDAFRQLPDLILNFEFSPRLQMEAYSNFEIYSR